MLLLGRATMADDDKSKVNDQDKRDTEDVEEVKDV